MDPTEKLALARRVLDLTLRPVSETFPRDKPRPSPKLLARINEMTDRRRAVLAELYAEQLSEAELLALEQHHGSELMRSVSAAMPRINAEAHKRMAELWLDGDSSHNIAATTPRDGPALIARVLSADPNLNTAQQAAVQRLIDDERLIETTHAQLVRNYLQAVAAGATGPVLARFYTSDAEQLEQPNRLNPQGGRSDLATLLARAEKGKHLLAIRSYELISLMAAGHSVAAEVRWTGTLAVALGTLAAGAELRAHIAMFFDMKEGRIHRQRNYDCVEAW